MDNSTFYQSLENGITYEYDNSKIVVGLDIGTTKVCAIVGKYNEFGKIDVLGIGSAPSFGVSRGVVTNIQKTTEAIKRAVSLASERSNVNISKVYVGIAGHHIKSYQRNYVITRPNPDEFISEVDLKRLENDITRQPLGVGEKIIHVLPQEYTIDDEHGVTDPIGMSGVRIECNYHIVTAHVSAVNNIIRCVKEANLEIVDIILEPIASAEAVLQSEELEAGVALVDIGGGTTDIAIFHENIIRHTCVIPFGGNIITEDVKEGCKVVREIAEKLKTQFGSAIRIPKQNEYITIDAKKIGQKENKHISIDFLTGIINARVDEIVQLVSSEITASGFGHKIIGVVITGGGSLLNNMTQLVDYRSTQHTRIGYPNEHLSKGMVDEVKSPMYATGIGLLKMGLKKSARNIINSNSNNNNNINFEEDIETKKQESKKARKNIFGLSGWTEKLKEFMNDADDDVNDFEK